MCCMHEIDLSIYIFSMRVHPINYENKKKIVFCVPSKIFLSSSHTLGKTVLGIKEGQIPQLSPQGTLELAGAFHCSIIFFSFLPLPACIHSERLAGPWTHWAPFGTRTLHMPSPSSAQDSTNTTPFMSQLKCHVGEAVLARGCTGPLPVSSSSVRCSSLY